MNRLFVVGVSMVSLLFVGCAPSLLKQSNIKNTPKNKEIYDLVQKYRVAMINRDVATLKSMVSRKYYENASTTDTTKDDYGFNELVRSVLPILRNNVKKVRYTIFLRKLTFKDDNTVRAEYEYFWRFLYTDGGKDRWSIKNDFNMIEFAKENGQWKIVSGL